MQAPTQWGGAVSSENSVGKGRGAEEHRRGTDNGLWGDGVGAWSRVGWGPGAAWGSGLEPHRVVVLLLIPQALRGSVSWGK